MSNSIRKKLMEEIERKTKKRQQAKVEAAYSQTLEGIVFDFFKNYDNLCSTMNSINGEDSFEWMYNQMFKEMVERIRYIDLLAKVSVFFPGLGDEDTLDSSKRPQSVTIFWGKPYQAKNGAPESTSIDVSQMLFS